MELRLSVLTQTTKHQNQISRKRYDSSKHATYIYFYEDSEFELFSSYSQEH